MKYSVKNFASDLVDYWRASDGGLTIAACNVIESGAWCDRLLGYFDAGLITRADIIAAFENAANSAKTGAESDVMEFAISLV